MRHFCILACCFFSAAAQQSNDLARPSDLRTRGVTTSPKISREEAAKRVTRGYALIIGISRYAYLSGQNLQFAESDAEAVHDVLINQESGNFEPENVRKLIGPRATRANIEDALERWLPSVASSEDRVVIYFAGHGFLAGNGEAYLAPYDLDPKRMDATAYSVERMNEVVGKRIKARWKVLLTDSCHSGGITPQTTNEAINDSLANVAGVLSLTATHKNERSFEDSSLGSGVFTYFLVQGLRGQADSDRDGLVTAAELVEYVRSNVYNYVHQRGEQQSPHDNQEFSPKLILAFNPRLVGSDEVLAQGELAVTANMDGVEFFLDGKSVGMVNREKVLSLPGISPGLHQVLGALRGYDPDGPREVNVYPGRTTTVNLRLQYVKRPHKKTAVDLFKQGVKLYNKGSEKECRQAADLFDKALAEDPSYSEAALYLGRAWQVLYEDEKALRYLKKAVDLDPNYTDARISYAALLLDRDHTQEAIVQLRHVQRIDPRNSLACSHLAQAYRLTAAYDKSIESAKEALQYDASNAQAYLWMGDSLRASKQFAKAKEAYLEFIRLTDFEASTFEKVGYYLLGNPFTTAFSKRRATEKQIYKDQRNIAYFGLCESEEKLGNLDGATKACRRALAYDPQDIFAHFKLGEIDLRRANVLLSKRDPGSRQILWASRNCMQNVLAINSEIEISRTAREYIIKIDDTLRKLDQVLSQ